MSILNVQNLTHMYGDKTIFHNVCFRVLKGEHAGLVGKNGAGKSTLLRILAGELLADEGKIEWFLHVKFGFLDQHIALQEGITIIQYLRSAFSYLYEIERTMFSLAEKMATEEHDLEQILLQYGNLQSILDSHEFYQIDTKIEEVASGLGIQEFGMDRDVSKLSGGQRTKLLLGKLLLEEPHVLLLDEPTNYLDTIHIEWLATYLKGYEHAYLVVSHDEHFLNEIINVTYYVGDRTIKRYNGNYETFVQSYEQSKQQLQAAYERQQKEIIKLENFIQKNKNRKAKQAKSREKVLGKIKPIGKITTSAKPRFSFHIHTEPVSCILEAKAVQIGYTKPLFSPINLQVKRGEKIAIVGHNGIGKTTLLKTLLGYLQPLSGKIKLGENVKPAYFAQEEFSSEFTPLQQIRECYGDMTEKEIRQSLARCGLKEDHIRQSLSFLSGGEQTKVRLCELMLAKSNVLILDEPTNHLDVHAKDALREALERYEGTVLLVSHEPAFYEPWITHVWDMEK